MRKSEQEFLRSSARLLLLLEQRTTRIPSLESLESWESRARAFRSHPSSDHGSSQSPSLPLSASWVYLRGSNCLDRYGHPILETGTLLFVLAKSRMDLRDTIRHHVAYKLCLIQFGIRQASNFRMRRVFPVSIASVKRNVYELYARPLAYLSLCVIRTPVPQVFRCVAFQVACACAFLPAAHPLVFEKLPTTVPTAPPHLATRRMLHHLPVHLFPPVLVSHSERRDPPPAVNLRSSVQHPFQLKRPDLPPDADKIVTPGNGSKLHSEY